MLELLSYLLIASSTLISNLLLKTNENSYVFSNIFLCFKQEFWRFQSDFSCPAEFHAINKGQTRLKCFYQVDDSSKKRMNYSVFCLTVLKTRSLLCKEKKFKHFVFYKYFCLILGLLKSKISKKSFEPFLRKLDFKLIHYKARVQPVGKITTIATRNRC